MEYNFPGDSFWLEKEKLVLFIDRQNLRTILSSEIKDSEIVIKRTSGRDSLNGVDSLDEYSSEIRAYKNIEYFNQLGIRDYLLQREDKDVHNRQNHSYGTAIIGASYFSALEPFIEDTIFKEIANDAKCKQLLNLALLLHDVGHLPFSHLMEEVFNDVNWTRGKGKYYRHDDAPLEQLSEPEKDGIKKAIMKTLDVQDSEKHEYFELLQDLIAGISGIPFLDAITNSAIDADKIDYIFRDMEYTGAMARFEAPPKWLENFFSSISLSPEGLVRLNGESSLCALQLLEERQFLYRTTYHNPKTRAFEKIAATVIISWLTRKISRSMRIPQSIDSDLRKLKGDKAYSLLMEEFYEYKDEFDLLINMCEQLADDEVHQDKEAGEWFRKIKTDFEEFKKKDSSKKKLRELSNDMIVEEPLYFDRDKGNEIRKVARDLYVDYPCGVLIDIMVSPRFLPSPMSRRFKTQNTEFVGEQFLVPNEDISKWGRRNIARIPLHCCNFSSLEQKFTQVVVINTLKKERRGEYIYDLFIKRCRAKGIEPIPFRRGE